MRLPSYGIGPTFLSLAILGSLSNVFASDPALPDPNYWRGPYTLRITFDDPNLPKYLLLISGGTFRATPDVKSAFPLYPSISSQFSAQVTTIHPVFNNSIETPYLSLFEKETSTSMDSRGLSAVWRSKPPRADGTPFFDIMTFPAWNSPGLYLKAATDVINWGGYKFVWDEKTNKATLHFPRFNGENGWRFVIYNDWSDYWYLHVWNGTTPRENEGWPSSLYRVIQKGIETTVEVVPIWTLTANSTLV